MTTKVRKGAAPDGVSRGEPGKRLRDQGRIDVRQRAAAEPVNLVFVALQQSAPETPSMNQFLKKILAAGRLVKSGRVGEATSAIQRALASGHAATMTAPTTGPAPSRRPSTSERADVASPTDVTTVEAPAPADTSWLVDLFGAEPEVVGKPGESRFLESSFTCAAGTRTFKLFEPAAAGDTLRPLIVMLHGCTQSPDDFAAGTRMNELAADQHVFVLYPAQAPRSNAHKCWNWFVPADQRRGDGEPALIAGMTRHVLQTHRIDPHRVFVAGLSAGGAMAAIMAREYPDLFAAAGIHSGVAPGIAHDAASAFTVMKSGPGISAAWQTPMTASLSRWPQPVAPTTDAAIDSLPAAPVIVFHGDADSTVAAANGDAVIAAALANAGAGTRADSEGESATGQRRYRRTVWRADGAATDAPSLAEQWVIRGAPHAWSGGAAVGSYTDPTGPDASREMLRFFLEHPRRPRRLDARAPTDGS